MLITKEVEVKVNTKTIEYYKSLGYDIPMKKASKSTYLRTGKEFVYDLGNTFVVKIEDLPKYSTEKVLVQCDMCKKEKMQVSYKNYCVVIERSGSYVCKNCGHIKHKNTVEQKYNVQHTSQLESVKAKKKETLLLHYGVEYPLQSPEIKARQINSLMEHYGVDNPFKSQEIIDRAMATNLERYGVPYVSQNDEIKEKVANTMVERYGVPYSSQSPELRAKAICTWKQNFGVDNPFKSPMIKEKQAQTWYKHSTKKCSKQQLYLFELYNISKDCELNFPVSYYNVDIYVPNGNIVVEYDGGGHKLSVISGQCTEGEYFQKELVRNNIIKCAGYKQMRIISSKDKLPSDEILLQMLSKAKQYFSDYPDHSWIEFNIDTSTARNAEQKDGVFFDYGKLRTIK